MQKFSEHPRSAYWDYDNNGSLLPEHLTVKSGRYCNFKCSTCLHVWRIAPINMCKRNEGCSFCSGQAICKLRNCTTCYPNTFYSHEFSDHWADDNIDKPWEVFKNSGTEYVFICKTCPNKFITKPLHINRNGTMQCSCCLKSKVCNNPNCIQCEERSFARHPMSQYWSDKNRLRPRQVAMFNNDSVYFDCPCGHEIFMAPHTVASGSWCKYCCMNSSEFCDNIDCKACFDKSLASDTYLMSRLSLENKIDARRVTKGSKDKLLFNCDKCTHSMMMSPEKLKTNPKMCKYCTHRELCLNDDCDYCFKHSFISSERSQYLADKSRNARLIPVSSNKSENFICEKGHTFTMTPNKITQENNWCPHCKYKTESIVQKFLTDNKYVVEAQKRILGCRLTQWLPFDFYLPELDIVIEIDGEQHFKQVAKWTCKEEVQMKDTFKALHLAKNGISLIRIFQVDIHKNRIDWKNELLLSIDRIRQTAQETGYPHILTISRDESLYDEHYKLLESHSIESARDEIELLRLKTENSTTI